MIGMRRTWSLLLVLAAAGCSKGGGDGGGAAGAPAASNPEADRATIARLRTEFAQNASAGDVRRVAAAYAPDAVLMQNAQPALVGQAAITEALEGQVAAVSVELSLTSAELVFIGEGWALDRGTYESVVRFRSSGEEKQDQGNYLVLWQRQPDGSWKIARDIDSSSLASR